MDAVGFVGVGSIGAPMARRLVETGHPTFLWARRRDALDAFAEGPATIVADVTELGRRCEVIGLCVRDGEAVDDVVHRCGLLAAMRPGTVLAIHATVEPDQVRDLAAAAAVRGVHVADAPVSGGPAAAAAGRLVVMVGAAPEVFARCVPVFDAFARLVVRVGQPGTGQLAKLVNNALFTANLRVADDALLVGGELGLERDGLVELLRAGSGGSFALDAVLAGTDLTSFGAGPGGNLLRKDVGIVRGVLGAAGIDGRELLRAADAGLDRMGLLDHH